MIDALTFVPIQDEPHAFYDIENAIPNRSNNNAVDVLKDYFEDNHI